MTCLRLLTFAIVTLAAGGCGTTDFRCGPRTLPQAASADEPHAYHRFAVAADHALASQAGLEMLQCGGNAVDAAVAASFCLSVVRPFSCGIGGGGFMLIHAPARHTLAPKDEQSEGAIALNYRETCPAAVGPDFYPRLDDATASTYGWRASGVPGTVAGLCFALEQYGTLDLNAVLQPAIRAAEDGFIADAAFVGAVRSVAQSTENRPDLRAAMGMIWSDLCRQGHVQVGDVIRNPDQAKALRLIAAQGPSAFYQGAIARTIDATMREHAGTLTLADLAGYRLREMTPLQGKIGGCEVLSMPPPSSGGIAMQQVFGVLNRRAADLDLAAHNSADYVHLTAEAMKHAFADRAHWLADAAFVPVPLEEMLSSTAIDAAAAGIDMRHTREPSAYGLLPPPPADAGTSHLCVSDASGLAVACTETINLEFGSLVCVPGFGFCLNNEMDDFTTRPDAVNAFGLQQSERNLPQPGKRPLSSMSPTIVTRNGRAILIAGGSGGPRIISAVTQCILNVMRFGMTPEQAVSAPRFHHQWLPNTLQVDKSWTDQATLQELRRRGHEIATMTGEAVVQMIAIDEGGVIRAASDPRKGGVPAGD